MLNILVMAQQLNIILPEAKLGEISPIITTKDILTIPTGARTTKRVRKKLSFGVMSDVDIVDTVEEILQCEGDEEIQLENTQILDTELSHEMGSLVQSINEEQSTIKEEKAALKKLKDQRTAEKRESSKRKAASAIEKGKRNEKQLKPQPNAKRQRKS